jgi:hypothetical protein
MSSGGKDKDEEMMLKDISGSSTDGGDPFDEIDEKPKSKK